jgi:hypothetical protein
MMPEEKWPDALAGAGGPECWNTPILCERFPRCELHGCRIVDRLPKGCPLATADPVTAIISLVEQAWDRAYRRVLPDVFGGRTALARAAVCDACYDRIAGNPHVVRLRDIALSDHARVAHTTDGAHGKGGVCPVSVSIASCRKGRRR